MCRVLAPGGRLVVSTWRSPQHNPHALEFARAVDRNVGIPAGDDTHSPFGWDDAGELASMLRSVGFEDTNVVAVKLDMHEPDLRRFVLNDLLAYPTTGRTSDARKEALLQEILGALSDCRAAEGWTLPWAAHVGTGSKR